MDPELLGCVEQVVCSTPELVQPKPGYYAAQTRGHSLTFARLMWLPLWGCHCFLQQLLPAAWQEEMA